MKSRRFSLPAVAGLLAGSLAILCTTATNATALTILRYLEGIGDGSDVPVAQLKAPTPTRVALANYDPARDAFPGLWIQQGGAGVGESDPTKYQLWLTGGGGFTLNGLVSNTIWTAVKNFDISAGGSLVGYLVECNADGTGCVQIASATVTRPDWDVSDTGTWIQDTFNFGFVNYTLGPGKSVGFKLEVGPASGNDMWLAYDTTAYPAWGQLVILAPGVSVNPTSGLTTTEAGGTATFTVVLDSPPSANVTIGLSSNDLTEGTVSPASVTFTPGNWSTAQTVTVTGVNDFVADGNVPYTIVTAAATSTDGSFNGLNGSDVGVTNNDNDTAGITVSPTSGLTTTEGGGTATFTVVLDSQPTANVTVGLSSNDLTEGTVAPASLAFTAGNWNTAQTVTVTGVNDFVADGDVPYTIVTAAATSTDPGYSGRNAADVGVTNTDNDTAGMTVSPTSGLTTTEAGGTATFTVVLTSQPTANVTIGLSSNDLTEGTVAPASLIFTAGNWNTAQTVTVTGVNDPVADGDVPYTIVTAPATSTDPGYSGRDAADVSVTNTDNDTAGITVNPTSGLTTTEGGGTATFTVVLTSQPTANVTIGLSSSDLTEGTVAPASVTFTSGNWNTAQTVTVTGVDDFGVDGAVAYTIVTAPATSTDPGYSGRDGADVGVTNTDNDTAGITVIPNSGLTTTEGGGTATFTVALTSQPTADVTIGLSSSDLTEGTVTPASVTFTSGNWNTAQTVTVTGVDDFGVDGAVPYTIVTAAATSTDGIYNGMNAVDVGVTNTDDDTAGITVIPTSGLTTTEGGGTATFTVVLTSQPTANVTIGLSSSDLTEGTVAPATLTFTSGNWNTAQTVTVTGVDDFGVDGAVPYTIVTAAATSTDGNYSGRNAADVSVTNTDDDTAGITVNPTSGLTTTEGGGTATFTVVLTSQPTANVTIGLSSSDLTEGTVGPASVTFTSGNWNTAQTVTVTGVDDFGVDGPVAYTIVTAAAASTDGNYSGRNAADVGVTNTDDDTAGITVNPTSGLTTTEGGGTATFTVALTSQPTANVTIGLSSSDLTEGTVAPASVTFTSGNWNTAQTVTVTGADDFGVDGPVAYSIVTAAASSADGIYNGMNAADVGVTNTDDDTAGITVIPTSGLTTTEGGGTATFTVALTSQPTANVTIGLSSSDLTEGTVAPASVTFTSGNWNTAQTVTVTGVDDFGVDGAVAYTIVTAAATSTDGIYNGMNPADVGVTNTDDDTAGISVIPTSGLTTTEGGGTATFTLALTSQPTANVTIGLSSSDLTEGTVAPASVTFTSGNWNTAQTVTVTGVDDFGVDGAVAYTVVTAAATSTDGIYNGMNAADVTVTNTDDDTAGITVIPTSGLTTTEGGGTATFTVALTSQPTANVTIGLSSSDLTEGTVAPASVMFTSGNWNTVQTVTVTGVDDFGVDGPVAYTIVTAAATSTDGNYSGRNAADVGVTNTDDDTAGITVAPASGLTTTEGGGTATFTVALTSQPTANVTIGLTSSDLTEGTVAPASVAFTPANWNTAQTVTVTGVDDFGVDGAVGYTIVTAAATSTDGTYNGMNAADVAVTNTDDDTAGITVIPTLGLTTTEGGGTATFTVVLTSQPTANVTIGLTSSDLTEGTVAPASLTFTSGNWNTAQTVTVSGVDDFGVDGPVAYSIVTAAATSTDGNYSGRNAADVGVTNTDDDTAGITVNPTSGLTTTEGGGTATFTVVLTSQPTANVTIGLSSSDLTEGTVAPASVTFTPANWNTAQTATVTGVDDFGVDGPVAYAIVTAAATSTDGNYSGRNAADVGVTNSDNDTAGITVNPTAGLTTTEGGGTATFTVVLDTQPTVNVTIGLSSSDLTEGTVAPGSLTFTSGNWNTAQTVTVTGVNDVVVDGAIAYTIVTAAATSTDGSYSGRNAADVGVTNTDDDTPGITVTPTSGLTTTESGGTAIFTVALNTQPTANVTIGLSSSDLTEGTVAPASLTFSPGNWNTAQTVTVTGVDDFGADGAIAYTIVTAAASSTDGTYNGFNAADVAVTNADNDTPGITVIPTSGLTTTEAGGTATFTVVLDTQPTANVTIGLSSSDLTEGTAAPASLTFTPANWNSAQTVTVTGVDDFGVDGNVAYTIVTAAATSTDGSYSGRNAADVGVTNMDDDTPGITVAPTSGLTTTEAGGTAIFTVVLDTQPTANVTIGLSSSDLSEGTVSPSSLTFPPGNWNSAQTVTITGVDDFGVDGNVAYTIVTAAATSTDASYSARNAPDVGVTNLDDDTSFAVDLRLTPARDRIETGQPVRYTLEIRNRRSVNLTNFEVQHELPPRFGYLPGSATRDGRAIADPTGSGIQRFALDTLAAFTDLNGDGQAGPGEPGYIALSWVLVPGASATPGNYLDAAVAFAGCSACGASNRAEATVRVDEDAFLARGTVVGRVFEDSNRDGLQGRDEKGLAGAVVVLDDGTSVGTDAEGRFHLPDLDPGPHVVKLDLERLGLPATVTTETAPVAYVSPGLLSSVRFGVSFQRDSLEIGRPPVSGVAIVADEMDRSVVVAGNALRAALVVNGMAARLRTVDASLTSVGLNDVLRLDGDRLREPAVFTLNASDASSVRDWTLDVRDQQGTVLWSTSGRRAPPRVCPWDGTGSGSSGLAGGNVYEYQLRVTYEDGLEIRGPRRAFGVDRGTSISMTMTGDSFEAGRAVLTPAAVDALAELAKALRRSPSEKVIVEGHTDSMGSPAGNLALSRARAEAAVRYLVERERIPRPRLVVLAFGQDRPVASNATPEGRELNRRVEIHGQGTEVQRARLYDIYRGEASARIGGLSVPVDSAGRFSCSVPLPAGDTLAVALSDRQGRTTSALLHLPSLEILEPRGEARVPYGGTAPGVTVGPRGAGSGTPQVAGLGAAPREQAAAHIQVSGRTDPGNRVEVDGVVVPVARAGEFSKEVPLHVGENGIALVVRDSAGALRVANLVVRVLDHADEGQDLVVVDRIPNLTVALPPAASVLSSHELRLSGQTGPGHRVWANAESLHVDEGGAFSGTVTLPEGKSHLKIAVEDAEGHRGEIDRLVDVRSKRLFLVALADGVIGKTTGSAIRGAGQSEGVWTEGRLAYHLKGWIAGRYLVTSAFDSRRRKFGELFKDLDDAGRDRLLVNLDPDRLYPVYGDSSAVAYGAPGGGRFFLAVEGGAFRASVGDFPISIDDVELAAFHRTLYGAQVRVGPPAGTPNPGTSLTAFGAAAREVHVRDEIRATGGTLYYLSHRDILEGSVQVSLVVRDRDTGLPLVRYRQLRGGDFNAKEIEGRLLFMRPIPSVWDDGSLVDGGQLQGQPVTIEAEYEARGSIEERAAVGGRFRQPIAQFLAVGGTVLQDEARSGPYRLWSGDTEVKVGTHARIVGEVARSEGVAGGTFVSEDGGLSFADTDSAVVHRGDAWKVAADLDVGEWLHKPGRVKVGAFVRRSEPGFTGSNDPGGQGFARHGAQAALEAGRWGWWGIRFNRERRLGIGLGDSAAVRDASLFGVQWRRDAGPFGVASEFEQRTVDSVSAERTTLQTGAASLWWRPIRPIRTSAERQQTFSGPPNHRTSLGVEWWPLPALALELRGSDGSTGRALRGGVALTVAGSQLYLREERNEGMGPRTGSTLLGAQSALGSTGRTYSEYRWLHDGDETRTQSVVGLERGWRYASGLLLRLSGEHSARDRSDGGGSRVALSSDVSYRGRLPVVATTRGEYRIDGAGGRERQVLTSTGLEWNLLAGISARGDYRLSFTRDRVANSTPARYEERSFGLAFRPPHSDRVEGFARWTLLRDRRSSAPGDTTLNETALGVTALETTVRILPGIDWVGKAAARIRGDSEGGVLGTGETHSVLWAQRLEYTVRKPFRYGIEYRSLSQREVGDRRAGWLNEVSWDPSLNFRLGVGYNFTTFSGDPLETGPESSHGWFLRAQSRY